MAATHSFSVETAAQEGLIEAIILQHIYFLQTSFIERGQKAEDVWVKRSVRALHITYPYLTDKQIRGAIDRMEERGLVVSKTENGYDRTKSLQVTRKGWLYFDSNAGANAFDERANGSDERANGFVQKGESYIGSYNSVSNSVITTTERGFDVAVFDSEVNALVVDSIPLEAEKEKDTPSSAAPLEKEKELPARPTPGESAPRRYDAFDIDREAEAMKQDYRVCEKFAIDLGNNLEIAKGMLPGFIDSFVSDQKAVGQTYNNRVEFRKHFFNLVRRKQEIKRNSPARPEKTLISNMRQL